MSAAGTPTPSPPALIRRWLPRRPGGPETSPLELDSRRIYVLPTAGGLTFAVALLAMLVASINYSLSLGYGLVFALAGAGLASIVHAWRNLVGLRIQPGRSDPVFAGETATLRFIIDNPRKARRPALRLKLHDAEAAFDLGPAQTLVVGATCAAGHRGRLQAGRTVIETRWPLGLIRAWSVFDVGAGCIVHPAPEADAPPLPASPMEQGGGKPSPTAGDDDFAGLRPHQRADSPRHVAWKVLARGGPLMTKQFAAEQGEELALDWAELPSGLGVEQRLSRLCAWQLEAERSGRPWSLSLPATNVPRGSGGGHLFRCLDELALYEGQDGADAT